MSTETFTLAGRTFGPAIPQTARMRLYYTKHFHAAGLDRLQLDWANDYPGACDRLQDAFCNAGEEGAYLLAAVLVEQGKVWSEKDAVTNANLFLDLSDPVDLDEFTEAMKLLLLSFFLAGVQTGREPGPQTGTPPLPTSPSSLVGAVDQADGIAEASISESGPTSDSPLITTPSD